MVKYFDIKQNVSRKGHFPEWDAWDLNKIRRLDNICSILMKAYGYALEEKGLITHA